MKVLIDKAQTHPNSEGTECKLIKIEQVERTYAASSQGVGRY